MAVLTRDILYGQDSSSTDIVLLGYHLADPAIGNRKPEVAVAGVNVPSENISVFYDRINVALTPELREKINLASNLCEPFRPFALKVMTFREKRHWWPFWEKVETQTFSMMVDPPRRYRIEAIADFHGVEVTEKISKFVSATSAKIWVRSGGGPRSHSESTNVTVTIPDEGNYVKSDAYWTHVGGADGTGISDVSRAGQVVSASGWIRGKSWNRGRAWGHLRLDVEYFIEKRKRTPVENVTIGSTSMGKESAFLAFYSTQGPLKSLRIIIRNEGCDKILDTIGLSLPEVFNGTARTTSRNGIFDAEVTKNSIKLSLSEI